MRSSLVMLLAGAALAWLLWVPHVRARAMVSRERAALAALREVAAGHPREAEGYRFEWVSDGKYPALCVGRPVRPGEDGNRWFAADKGGARLFEYDPVLYRPRGPHPDPEQLRRFLAVPVRPGEKRRLPLGWKPASAR